MNTHINLQHTFIISFLLILLGNSFAFAQNVEFTKQNVKKNSDFKKALKWIKKGDVYYNELSVANKNMYTNYAILYYKKAYKINPNSATLNYKMANSYTVSLNKKEAKKYADKAFELNPSLTPHLYFVLGEAYRYNGLFEQSESYFRQYIAGANHLDSLVLAEKYIQEIANAKMFIAQPKSIKVSSISEINTKYADYAPFIHPDSSIMYFTSRQPMNELDSEREDGFAENIYISRLINEQWSTPDLLGIKLNKNKSQNRAFIGFNAYLSRIYVYSSQRRGSILEGKYENGKVKKLRLMPAPINTKHSTESHITFTKDGKIAYFISDREGGYGGKDVWKTERIDEKTWSTPVNLGPNINSAYDEDGVYIFTEGNKLYLSSKGFNSMGGFDIYEASMDDQGNFSVLKNLGYPINGYDDDIFYGTSTLLDKHYFSSIKPDTKGLIDIYVIEEIEKDVLVEVFVKLVDDVSGDSITTAAKVKVFDENKQLIDSLDWDAEKKSSLPLSNNKSYTLVVEKDGYETGLKNVDLAEKNGSTDVIVYIKKEKKTIPSVIKTPEMHSTELQNVYFDFDQYRLTNSATIILNKNIDILKENATMQIVVVGHTDSQGAEKYNNGLSMKRANAVVQYLIKNGIPRSRIVKVKGKGELQPIADNDSNEGRSKNRRVELKIK